MSRGWARRTARAAVLWLAAAAWCAAPSLDPQRYIENVRYLASPEMRGRGTGMPELDDAARFIAGRFESFGLRAPLGQGYFQSFNVTTNARPGKNNRFAFYLNGRRTALASDDFAPYNFSSPGRMGGQLVFAGYGITAGEYGYDDYSGIDVKGKIVLILRHEPQEFDEESVFAGRAYTEHAQAASKAGNARRHGAVGVILVSDRASHRGDEDLLEAFSTSVGPGDAGIPCAQVKLRVAERWFQAAKKDLDELQDQIDRDLKPRSFAFPGSLRIEAQLDLEREARSVHNVAAYLPGETDEYIVVGAHFDHLGLGEQFSMAPSMTGTVHPGADDNASGTAGVIELARYFASRPRMKRGVLFLAFAGEEIGLLGSSFYVNHPLLPVERAVAMVNLDMIGRVREGKVFVGGTATGSTFKQLLERITARHTLKVDYSEKGGYGSSDHTSFITRQVPVLFFFSGLHEDYHKPEDTWDKIDAAEAVKLLALAADVVEALSEAPERPAFVKPAAQR